MKKILEFIKKLFSIDEDEIKNKAALEAQKRFNIQRIQMNGETYDVICFDGIAVSLMNHEEETGLLQRLANYRMMYVKMCVAKKEVV